MERVNPRPASDPYPMLGHLLQIDQSFGPKRSHPFFQGTAECGFVGGATISV